MKGQGKSWKEIQDQIIKKYRITINEHSTCRARTHAHPQKRMVCKWIQSSSIQSTFTLFHEIGHCVNNNSKMRRCEEEFYATQWALDKCRELGIDVPNKIIEKYQSYIYRGLDRGIARGGFGYPTREEMKLIKG